MKPAVLYAKKTHQAIHNVGFVMYQVVSITHEIKLNYRQIGYVCVEEKSESE